MSEATMHGPRSTPTALRLEPIAITGMSCRFPGAPDIEAFWRLLERGIDAITEIPADRFDIRQYYDPDPEAPGKMYVRAGGFLENVFDFDPGFFGISPREALSMDPQQRLLLELAWEALEDAGDASERLSGRNVGVFIGHSTNDYVRRSFGREIDAYSGTGSATSIAAGRISYVLGLTGPNLPVDTACSSSLVALHLACQSLRARECELALAAGVNLMLAPEPTIYFCKMRALAPDGRCKAFDSLANGYVRGEGCGAIVLKRLADACAAGDRIHAVIRGSAVNQDGRSTGLTAPNRFAQEALLRGALDAAGVSAQEVTYLEAHGTGTPLGDPIEIQAIAAVHAGRPDPLFVGSVKTNIGHLEAAAGIAGVIKTVLAMQRARIPPHLHFHQPSPYIPWQSAPVVVPTELVPWLAKDGRPRLAGVSSFGFSGTNAHVVIEEAPASPPGDGGARRPLDLLCLSAKGEPALAALARAMSQRLDAPVAEPLADVCYSANTGRTHFADRLSIIAADQAEARVALLDYLNGTSNPAVRRGTAPGSSTPKVAFLFSGQGSQYVHMGRELYDSLPLFRQTLHECDALLGDALEPSLLATLYPENPSRSRIDETGYSQPVLFAFEFALATVWRSWGVEPVFCLGHSIGELVAACVAGAFCLEDGLRLAADRGRLMQALPRDGMMASVHADVDTVRGILEQCESQVAIAAVNGPMSTVISGRREDAELVLGEMTRRGMRCQPLTVSHAFHSSLMDPILHELEEIAARVRYTPPRIGLVSNVTGRIAEGDDLLTAGYWRRHARGPVLFADGIRALDDRGYGTYVEIGPQPVLSGLARTCVADRGQLWAASLRRQGGAWAQMLETLSQLESRGVSIDWRGFDGDYQRRRVSLPTYPFQRTRYVIEGGDQAPASVTAPTPSSPPGEDPSHANGPLYATEWQPSPLQSFGEPERGRWLIFVDDTGLGPRLARELESRGSTCVLVEPAAPGGPTANGRRQVRPDQPDDFTQLLAAVEEDGPCVGVVHAWSLNVRCPGQDGEGLAGASLLGTGSVLALVQALATRRPQHPPPLWLVTRGVHRIHDEDPADGLAQAPLWGLARSMAIEYPVLRCGRMDLDSGAITDPWLSRATTSILTTLGARDGEDQIAFRGGERHVPRLRRSEVSQQPVALVASATYLVTGGLGGLGLLVADWMIRQGARHLVLCGRSEPTPAAAETIAGFRARGAEVVHLMVDVAEAAQAAALFRRIAETMPPLKGIVHAAGVLDDGTLARQDWGRFVKVMRPKVDGAWQLHLQSLTLSLDFLVLFSTIGSVLGAPSQSNYCAANAFLDALAHYRRAHGQPALSVNWGPWAHAGMAARQQAGVLRTWETLGIELLPAGDALEALATLVGTTASQVAVIKADWSKLVSLFPQGLEPPLLRDLVKGRRHPRLASGEWREMAERVAGASDDEALRQVRRFVARLVAEVLGRSDADALDSEMGFFDLGMDSMMAVDLTARLRANVGDTHLLPASFVFDNPTIERVSQYLLRALDSSRAAPGAPPRIQHRSTEHAIAVVGYACRFPGAATANDFWDLVALGRDAIREVPADRWDIDRCYDPNPHAPGKMYVRDGGFLEGIDQFDARFFGISPREAVKMDPQHRLLLETAWCALEKANQPVDRLRGADTGVFIGISGNDYVRVLGQSTDAAEVDAYLATGNALSISAGRLSHAFGFEGPCLAVDTACSSSLVAVHLACESLRSGKARVALAGGVNVILAPEISISLCKIGALAPDGRCKTFDATANGYVRGEGCGVVVLKRLDDARRDGDRILATILASAINHDGRSSGITVPNGAAQVALYRDALSASGASPQDVHYVEAHGTGTPLGDPIEMLSIASVYADGRPAERPLLVGSVKTNIGHLEAAAGVAGLIKVVQSLEHGSVPASLHFRQPSPQIDWRRAAVRIPSQTEPWPEGHRRVAAVSSFGFSGTNAHCIVEQAAESDRAVEVSESDGPPVTARPRPAHLLCLSAKTEDALLEHARNVATRLSQCDDARLADVCFSLNAGRTHFPRRLALVASTARDAQAHLALLAEGSRTGRSERSSDPTSAPRVAFLFPGLEAQYVGMGRQLFETQPEFRRIVDEADAVLADVLGGSLRLAMYPAPGKRSSLGQARYAQPSLFVLEYALFRLWTEWGLKPAIVAGHSIGECAAACAAGVFTFADGLKLVGERARLIHGLPRDGGMLALVADEETVRAALVPYGDLIYVAALNSPRNTVVAGPSAALADLAEAVAAGGIRVHRLGASHAFHSPAMSGLADGFLRIARSIGYREPDVPVVSPATGGFAAPGTMSDPAYWARQLVVPVRFREAVRTLAASDVDVFLELGPRPQLTVFGQEVLGRAADRQLWLPGLRRGGADWDQLLGTMGRLYVRGVDFDWKAFDRGYRRRWVDVPAYPFQRQRFWPTPAPEPVPALAPTAATAEPGRGEEPLLGHRLRFPGLQETIFENRFSADHPALLSDHKVQSRVVVPAACHLSMVMAAAAKLDLGQGIDLRDVDFPEGMILADAESRLVQLIVAPQRDGAHPFRIVSSREDEQSWLVHSSGRLLSEEAALRSPHTGSHGSGGKRHSSGTDSIPAIRRRCGDHISDTRMFYRLLAQHGIELGPQFQWIEEIWRRPGEALARLRLPGAEDRADAFVVHPGWIDACFQLLTVTLTRLGAELPTYLPIGIGRLVVYDKLRVSPWIHVTLRPQQDDEPATFEGDIRILSESGQLAGRIDRFRVRRAPRESLSRFAQRRVTDSLYTVQWVKSDPSEPPSPGPASGTWLVLEGADDTGAELARVIEREGGHCLRVRAGPWSDQDGDGLQVDPASLESYRELVRRLAEKVPELRGVVHLWSASTEVAGVSDWKAVMERQTYGAHSVLNLVKALTQPGLRLYPRLWLVTSGAEAIPDRRQVVDVTHSPLWGLGRVIALEHPQLRCTRIDLDPAATPRERASRLLREIGSSDREDQIAYDGEERYVARLSRHRISSATSDEELQLPGSAPYRIVRPAQGSLAEISAELATQQSPGPGEVEIRVKAAGVNFRDVLNALGLYPGNAGGLGWEVAGAVTSVGAGVSHVRPGDDVVALAPGSFAKFVTTDARLVVRKPARLALPDAAASPVVFLTAHYALGQLAKLSSGDKVLIHAAAGGVGLAAVQLAQQAGAEVFATAGSQEKRQRLKDLGVPHVFDSRSLDFGPAVTAATGGTGVDVVLNSLAGDFIPASLALLARHGRFVEIGKLGIWTPEQVARSRADVEYFVFSLDTLVLEDAGTVGATLAEIMDRLGSGLLEPIPRTVFPVHRAKAAFRYMAQAKHIGKIVLDLDVDPQETDAPCTVRDDATYLITGGLGGLGLCVAHWLVEQGARHLVLTSLHGPSAKSQEALIALERLGARVLAVSADVTVEEQVRTVVERIDEGMPPLRGVFHLAGLLEDGLLMNQDWNRFVKVMSPKIQGAINLHEATSTTELDFFVMFSSSASILGFPGQGNYAAANGFLDAFTPYRLAQGRPAQTINWGAWDEIGMTVGLKRQWRALGIGTIKADQGMETLGLLMRARSPRVAVLPVDWSQIARSFPGGQPPAFLASLAHEFSASQEPTAEWLELRKRVSAAPAAERKDLVVQRLLELGRVVLGLRTSDALDAKTPLNELGFDSLMAVELANTLSRSAGKAFSATLLFDYPTFDALANHLLLEVLAPPVAARVSPGPASAPAGGVGSRSEPQASLVPSR